MHSVLSQQLFAEQVLNFDGELLVQRRWTVFARVYPVLDVGFEWPGRQPFRVRFECTDWNELPPSVSLLDAGGAFLAQVPQGAPGIFHQGPHQTTGRPFVCMAGTREYHTHPGHLNDLWENYKQRSGFDLGGILTQIWDGWMKMHS